MYEGAKYIKDAETVAFPVESMDFAPEFCSFIAIFAQQILLIMDVLLDYAFWFYLLLMVLLFLGKRKKAARMAQKKKESSEDQASSRKVSWEELMRELRRQTEVAKNDAPVDDTFTEVFPVQELVTDETVPVDETVSNRSESDEKVEVPVSEEERKDTLLQSRRKSVAEGQDDVVMDANTTWTISTLEDAKRAFVYSEILKPKFND